MLPAKTYTKSRTNITGWTSSNTSTAGIRTICIRFRRATTRESWTAITARSPIPGC